MRVIKSFLNELKKDKLKGFLIIIFVIYAMLTFELFNRPLIGTVRSIKIALDDKIPFIKELIPIYHLFMPMLIWVGMMLFISDKKEYMKYIWALFLAQTSAYLIFTFFQTDVPRYDIGNLGTDIFSKLIKLTYRLDNHYAGAPSLHVCNMLLAILYYRNIDSKCKWPVIIFMGIIASTTVLVKQHVILDVPTGIIHALIWYNIIEYYFKGKEIK